MKNSKSLETNSADFKVYTHQKVVGIIYENYLIAITYSAGCESEAETEVLYNEYKSFFSAITDGIVIYSKWNK